MGLPLKSEHLTPLSNDVEFGAYCLVILSGPDKGKSIELSKERVVIGRGKNCDIIINDQKSSREHAEIVYSNGQYFITDLKSQNGLILNKNKITQSNILDGDKIIIGQTWFRVALKNKPKEIEDEIKPKKKTNKFVFYVLLLLVVAIFMMPDSEDKTQQSRKGDETVKKFSEVNAELVKKINDQQKQSDKEMQKNIDIIVKRGLRELREKNYYRATLEFTHALDLSPKDSQASFYLRRTQDELDQVIKELNLAALRDIESLHYQRAKVSYCAIMRLLYNFKMDKRLEETKERINELEIKMGKEKGEINCY